MSGLKPESSLMVGLATATVVYGIYQAALPNLADVRSLDARNSDVESAERLASWTAAGVVAGIALLAQDMTVFIIGGAMVTGMAWWNRHANEITPLTGKPLSSMSVSDLVPAQTQAQAPAAYQAPQYDATII